METMGILPVCRSPVPHKKAEKSGGGFSAQFSGIIIFSLELYLGTNFVPNVLKSFVSYSVNEI